MAINIGSESSCRRAYLNYHCYGNTMGIKPEEMGQITQVWEDRLESWQKTVSKDINEYEFDDSDFEKYHDEGFEEAKDTTGHNGKKGGMITRGVVDSVAAAGGAVVSSGIAGSAVNSVGSSLVAKSAEKAGEKAVKKASEEAIKEAGEKALGKTVSVAGESAVKEAGENAIKEGAKESVKEAGEKVGAWIISAPLALAQGIAYLTNKPNKDEKEACDVLQNEMTGAQAALDETQTNMQTASEGIITLSDQANEVNENANVTIQNHKTEYDSYMKAINYLKDKAASGKQLSDSEKALYKELITEAKESGTEIEDTSTEVTDEVVEIYDDMSTYQEDYDLAAENIGQIEGLTDFAEGIDQATQTMCYVEATAQGLNATAGLKAAAGATKFALSGGFTTAWGFAFAAMGASGAAMSGVGSYEQIKWAGEVGTEIEMRKVTQDLNTATNEIYTEEIDAYAGLMQVVEDLDVDIPDDIKPPEDVPLPESSLTKAAAATANKNINTGGLLFSTTPSKTEEDEKSSKVKKNKKD